MNLHTLTPAEGSTHREGKRVGRGNASGKGGTSGRGNKGAGQRSGTKRRRGSEGGQMPIHRRLPKRGFKNINHIDYKVFNIGAIEKLAQSYAITEITPETLYVTRLIGKTDLVKILGNGEIKTALTFKVNAITETAKKAIEAAGGSVEII
jgi:large subunit ribosomal protein L15